MTSAVASTALATASGRLKSIDVLRGATIAAMILVNAEFSPAEAYPEFAHSAWNGWTFADTIYPCFMFLIGVSLTLSTASRIRRGEDRTQLMKHALGRSLLIAAFGIAIDYLRVPAHEFPYIGVQNHLQLSGALQLIAVSYLIAFVIYLWSGLPGVITGIIGLNLLYLGFLFLYPVPGCGSGSLDVGCNFPNYIDQVVLGPFRWDIPCSVVGAIPTATSSILFGVLAGEMMLHEHRPLQQIVWLLVGGVLLIVAGELFAIWLPINKQLWTSSFAIFTAGLSATTLACAIWLIDCWPPRRWYRPLEILGMNAIAAYLISRLVQNIPRVHIMGKSLYTDVLAQLASPPTASLLFAVVVLAIVYVAIWLMDRQGWRLKV